jgi:hypothetical protein
MNRSAVLLVVVFVGMLRSPETRACSVGPGVWYHAAKASGLQPRNAGVLARVVGFYGPGDAGPRSFQVFDDGGQAIAHEATPLRGYASPEAVYLIKETVLPVPGHKRLYQDAPRPYPPLLQLEYGDELDMTPPALAGPIRLWVDRGHTSGGCFGGPFPGYVAGVLLPAANEQTIVSIYATDANGREERLLRDVIAHPDRAAGEVRLDFSGDFGRTVCLAFKTTDLAGNATPLGPPCCADERSASGPCERAGAPPREYFIAEPDAGAPPVAGPGGPSAPAAGGGCSLSPRSRASAAWIWLAVVFGWVVRARRHRKLARPVAIAVAALLLIGCDEDGGNMSAGDAGAGGSANPSALQPIWGADSQRLEITCSAVFGGNSQFAANRDQLTEPQLAAVARLRARRAGKTELCYVDGASCRVVVVGADGARATFRAPYESECDSSYQGIPWASLGPVLGALDCRLIESGRPLRPNPYCGRGLNLTASDDPLVHVAEPGAYGFELSSCGKPDPASPPKLQVLDQAGALAVELHLPEDRGPRDVCLQAVHRFTQPGLYRVKPSGVANEDFNRPTLRFTRAPDGALLQAIWGSESQRLEMSCSLGVGSVSQFAANRDQMTAEQLRAAEALRGRLVGEDRICYLDGASCVLDVVAAGGARTTLRAPLEDECDLSHRVATRASFKPLFDLLDCTAVSRSAERPLNPNSACDRGLYATGPGDIWVQVPEAGSFGFELAFCARPGVSQPPHMRLADEAGVVLVEARAPADPGPRQTCQQLVHTFAQPGRFRVQVDGGIAEVGALSPMTLRFARAAAP